MHIDPPHKTTLRTPLNAFKPETYVHHLRNGTLSQPQIYKMPPVHSRTKQPQYSQQSTPFTQQSDRHTDGINQVLKFLKKYKLYNSI